MLSLMFQKDVERIPVLENNKVVGLIRLADKPSANQSKRPRSLTRGLGG
jgi:hypothetical protein